MGEQATLESETVAPLPYYLKDVPPFYSLQKKPACQNQ